MTAKELLCKHENDRLREKRLKYMILWTREKIRDLDSLPCRSTRQMNEQLSHIERKLQTYEEDLDRISKERRRIHKLITGIPGIEGEVLKRRYIDGEIWEEICGGIHYSWHGAFKIHDRGLRMVQERLDQGDLFDT